MLLTMWFNSVQGIVQKSRYVAGKCKGSGNRQLYRGRLASIRGVAAVVGLRDHFRQSACSESLSRLDEGWVLVVGG